MLLNDWFDWKGTRCTSYGIRVTQQPEIIRPPERAAFTSVPGRSGTLTTLEGTDVYDDFLLTVECIITDTSQLNVILAWLKGDDKVTFANRQGGFYYARIVNQISLEQILRGNPHRRFSVTFRCQPFFYLSGIPDITVTATGTYVNNVGSVFAEPILKVTLTGDAQITVGASYIEVLGLTGIVTIDTPLMETYKNYTSYNNHMTGDFPLLHTGQNLISWTGGVTQIVITPNWRQL
jgi:phage-related protein